jgi:signal transduction histidine kinase
LDLENFKKGNGLKNMRMRAELINAKIEFKNENGLKIIVTKNKI